MRLGPSLITVQNSSNWQEENLKKS